MKTQEKITCRVHPAYLKEQDSAYLEKHDIMTDRYLYFDIEMKKLMRVEDVYKDGTTFHKTLQKGIGTASPYSDYQILSKYFNV